MSLPINLLGPLLHGAEVEGIFSSQRQLVTMVEFEVALAYALEASGIVPPGTGDACKRGSDGFPTDEHAQTIAQRAAQSGNLAIPFVKLLTDFVRFREGDAADFIHYGATSQDLLDTVLVLTLREYFALVSKQIHNICAALISLIEKHRDTLLAGRTWLQQGPPITFALKATQWLSAMLRHLDRLGAARDRSCLLQFGGAVGTLASLGTKGPDVTRHLSRQLALAVPDIPWHSQRDSLVESATIFALIDGTLGKIARDLTLMLQNEVAEVQIEASEATGGSSTMPHKRNPVSLAVVLSASVRAAGLTATMFSAMVQEHERGLGGWHAEWETLPDLCRITAGSLDNMLFALEHLKIDQDAMRRNMDLLHGVTLAESVSIRLSQAIGRPAAHHILERASREAIQRTCSLLAILREDPDVTEHLSFDEIEKALDSAAYLGSANIYIDQVLAHAAESLPSEVIGAIR